MGSLYTKNSYDLHLSTVANLIRIAPEAGGHARDLDWLINFTTHLLVADSSCCKFGAVCFVLYLAGIRT
jgi:hypothetical protein